MLVGLAELLHGDEVRALRQRIEVVDDARPRRETVAELVPEELLGGLGEGGGGEEKKGEGDSSRHACCSLSRRFSLSRAQTRDQPSHRANDASWLVPCGVTADPASARGINLGG